MLVHDDSRHIDGDKDLLILRYVNEISEVLCVDLQYICMLYT